MYEFISQETPEELKKKGFMLVDMHYHSNHSDGAASVSQILEKAANLGIGISITDHNDISGALEALDIKQKKTIIIPGIEVKSKELIDILFYFYEKEDLIHFFYKEVLPKRKKILHTTKTDISLKELMSLRKKYRCISSVAHPYGYSVRTGKDVMKHFGDILKKGDFIEVMNGGNTKKQNIKAINLAIVEKKGFTAGSDGHSIYALGKMMTCAKSNNVADFLNSIKKKQNIIIGKENKFGKLEEYGKYAINRIRNTFRK